jgi:hypothetical protein
VYGARLEIRVPQPLRERFALAARARHLSQSEAGRMAIEAFVASTLDAVSTEAAPGEGRPQNSSDSIDQNQPAADRTEVYAPV